MQYIDRVYVNLDKKEKMLICGGCCFVAIALIIGISAIIYGNDLISDGEYLNDKSTLEKCIIVQINELTTCKGNTRIYEYVAITEDKCSTTLLISQHKENEECVVGFTPKLIGNEYDCYVPDCSDKIFSFTSGDDLVTKGSNWIIGSIVAFSISGLIICVVIVVCCYHCIH
eukprot:163418_1